MQKRRFQRDLTVVYSYSTKEKTKPNSSQKCAVIEQEATGTAWNTQKSENS